MISYVLRLYFHVRRKRAREGWRRKRKKIRLNKIKVCNNCMNENGGKETGNLEREEENKNSIVIYPKHTFFTDKYEWVCQFLKQ
jgi:hypothetical protein